MNESKIEALAKRIVHCMVKADTTLFWSDVYAIVPKAIAEAVENPSDGLNAGQFSKVIADKISSEMLKTHRGLTCLKWPPLAKDLIFEVAKLAKA